MKKNKIKIIYLVMLILILLYKFIYDIKPNCTGFVNYCFVEEKIGGYIFYRQNTLTQIAAKLTFEEHLFLLQKYEFNVLLKNYKHKNISSPISHPNLYFGVFNNMSINYPFSHHVFNKYYCLVSNKEDLKGLPYNQYMSSKVYFYDNNFLEEKKSENLDKIKNFNLYIDIYKQIIFNSYNIKI